MDAVISLWLDSHIYQEQQQHIIEQYTERCHAYFVTESEPIANTQHPAKMGEQTQGMCQIVFIQQPDHLKYTEWLDIWHNHHISVAIETQATFEPVPIVNQESRSSLPGRTFRRRVLPNHHFYQPSA